MKKVVSALLLCSIISFNLPAFAADPSLHEVYQAANSGHMAEAQRMMKEVLQSHPNSGKAHYVEAELLAKQGNFTQAANELASAEKLSPGLTFATPESVSSLKKALSHPVANASATSSVQQQYAPQAGDPTSPLAHFPWGLFAIGIALVAFIVWASRWMTRRNPVSELSASQPGYGGYHPAYPNGQNSPSSPSNGPSLTPSGTGSSLGSQVLGGLATGAAVGAGVVAGEALMHHFMDDKKTPPSSNQTFSEFNNSIPDLPATPLNEMGSDDFGISDGGSWDDDGASDEWN